MLSNRPSPVPSAPPPTLIPSPWHGILLLKGLSTQRPGANPAADRLCPPSTGAATSPSQNLPQAGHRLEKGRALRQVIAWRPCTDAGKENGMGDPISRLQLARQEIDRVFGPIRRRFSYRRLIELAPLHSITSSARASSDGGTSRPSAFAVLRLTISSAFVDCWTGRSAAFSPLGTAAIDPSQTVRVGNISSIAH